MRKRRTLLFICIISVICSGFAHAEWYDTFYQYRIPLELDFNEPGWNVIPLDAATLTGLVNKNEELKMNPVWFAYNHLKVVEVDKKGKVIDQNPTTGFYLLS